MEVMHSQAAHLVLQFLLPAVFSVTGSFTVSGGTCDLTASGASNVSVAGDF